MHIYKQITCREDFSNILSVNVSGKPRIEHQRAMCEINYGRFLLPCLPAGECTNRYNFLSLGRSTVIFVLRALDTLTLSFKFLI